MKHVVAFDTAYGGERMRAYLFLPKNGSPPYQTVIFFPAADAFHLRSSRDMSLSAMDFIVGSGRAFLYPVYKGTYERGIHGERGPNDERDLRVAWSRDLGRAIDYLETRSDIDRSRLAFYGISDGADAGVILTALEPRLKTGVLQATGHRSDGAAGNRSRELCATHAHPDIDVEWALRLRRAGRDAAESTICFAGIAARSESASGVRERPCADHRRCTRRDSAVAGPLSRTGPGDYP